MPFEHAHSAFDIVTAAGPSVAAGVAEKMPLDPLVPSGPLGVPLRTCRAAACPTRPGHQTMGCIQCASLLVILLPPQRYGCMARCRKYGARVELRGVVIRSQ